VNARADSAWSKTPAPSVCASPAMSTPSRRRCAPRALAARLLGPLQAQPALALLGLIGAAGLHRAGAARLVPQLLIVWRVWRALRGWLRR
jgi:hypothetical protein